MSTIALFAACTGQMKNQNTTTMETTETVSTFPKINEGDVMAGVNLTVAESKRLIAKGIVHHPQVKAAMEKGIIVITNGTTNTYLAEELVGLSEPRGSFVTGHIVPQNRESISKGLSMLPYITLVDGKQVSLSSDEAINRTQKGDVVFKGANLLNYEKKQAGVCIGGESGGTMARIRDTEAHVIVPVGLEKEVFGDLSDYEKLFANRPEQITPVPRVWLHSEDAEIFTEIEAIKTIAAVNVVPYAAGGVAGSEGGISLAIYGTKEEVQKALDFVRAVQGERVFVE